VDRVILKAPEGKIYTNGEIYGTTIYLAVGVNPDDFYTISIEEYEEILKQQELMLGG
jgi:hypothetical protein